MARGRKPAVSTQAKQLATALAFVTLKNPGLMESRHYVKLGSKMAIVVSEQIAVGYPIEEDLEIYPHLEKLKAALSKAGSTLAITVTPKGSLSVKGDKLTALVNCLPACDFPFVVPDAKIAVVDDRLKIAFAACGSMASESASSVMFASLKLDPWVCTAILSDDTSAIGILQVMHGLDVPPDTILPKAFTEAVCKADSPLTGLGLTWSNEMGRATSVTLWFENGAWIKTQCYSDRWTEITHVTDAANYPVEVPAGLFDACAAIATFSEDSERPNVFFATDKVMSHNTSEVGAQYEVKGLVEGKRFQAKLLKTIAPFVKAIDLTTYKDKAYFTGGDEKTPMRGCIMSMTGGIGSNAPRIEPVDPPGTAWGGAEITGDDDEEPDASDVNPHIGWG
jgi:hypothetical protein